MSIKVTLSKPQLNTSNILYENIKHPSPIRNSLVFDSTAILMTLLGVPIGAVGWMMLECSISEAETICGYVLSPISVAMVLGGLKLVRKGVLNFAGENINKIDSRTTEDDLIKLIKFKNRIFPYDLEASEVKEPRSDNVHSLPYGFKIKEAITEIDRF